MTLTSIKTKLIIHSVKDYFITIICRPTMRDTFYFKIRNTRKPRKKFTNLIFFKSKLFFFKLMH